MEKNNNITNSKKTDTEEQKENVFKNLKFYLGFLCSLVPFLSFCIYTGDNYWDLIMFILCVPYLIVSIIVWLIFRKRQSAFAYGVLLAGIAPFVILLLWLIVLVVGFGYLINTTIS